MGEIVKSSYPVQVIFREYFEGIIAAIFLAAFLRFFVLSVMYIPTSNMQPNLERGDFVLGWRLSYGFPLPLTAGERLNQKLPKRGDIVSFRFPGDEDQLIIRRVVGLPGDKIAIKDGRLMINMEEVEYIEDENEIVEKLPEEKGHHALKLPLKGKMKMKTIPEGKFFVLSDHRSLGDDSKSWGLVPLENIESKIFLVWLSVDNFEQEMKLRWSRMFEWVR